MTTCIALLRGVNVGGHRRLPMAELRSACAEAGFDAVRNYIQSGNLVLASADDTRATEARIEAAIHVRFGFAVDVVPKAAAAEPAG